MEYEPTALKIGALGWPDNFQWEKRPRFVCDKDRMHAEELSRGEDRTVWREHRRRRDEAFAEMRRRINETRAERARSKREPL